MNKLTKLKKCQKKITQALLEAGIQNVVMARDVEKDGKAEIEIPIKAVDIYGLHGHLLKLWSYDDGLESEKTEAESVETVTEEGLDGEGEYPSKIKITRNLKVLE